MDAPVQATRTSNIARVHLAVMIQMENDAEANQPLTFIYIYTRPLNLQLNVIDLQIDIHPVLIEVLFVLKTNEYSIKIVFVN